MGTPFRSPLGYNKPTVMLGTGLTEVQVSVPNENPSKEDDLTIGFVFTNEGIIFELLVSDGEEVCKFSKTYSEVVEMIYNSTNNFDEG